MLRLKPTNIFDFFAPTGGSSKIADFSMRQKNMGATPASTTISGTSRSTYSPPTISSPSVRTSSNSNHQWFYWLCGAVIIVAAIDYLAERSNEDEKNNKN